MRQACFIVTSVATLFLAGCGGGSGAANGGIAFNSSQSGNTDGRSSLVSQAGVELSRSEISSALATEQRALETAQAGQAIEWQGSASGRGGTVIAAQPYRVGSQDCRPYAHVVRAGGLAQSVRGTACRNPDGSWTLLN